MRRAPPARFWHGLVLTLITILWISAMIWLWRGVGA